MELDKSLRQEIEDLKIELKKAEEALENSPHTYEPKPTRKNKKAKKK